MSESMVFAQKVAFSLGWFCLTIGVLSMLTSAYQGSTGHGKPNESERNGALWWAVTALIWLVAK